MSARSDIVNSLVEILKTVNGTTPFKTTISPNNITNKLLFWDEVSDFPFISVVAGGESRDYLPSGFKWGRLTVSLKIYVQGENPVELLEGVLQDVERVLDSNNELEYDTGKTTQDIRITSIDTDEGLMVPFGIGEVTLQILYQVLH